MSVFSWNPTNWIASAVVALSPAPPQPDQTKPAVVLIHGIYDTGAKMTWLARRFNMAGYETFCPTLSPSNGKITLEASAKLLDSVVRQHFGAHRQLHVIGFSMGGLISRYWLANFPIRSSVVSFATISTPHQGTLVANSQHQPGILEMRPGSEFLNQLTKQDLLFTNLHPLSVYTPLDLIILPATSSKWPIAKNETHWSVFHPLMVFSPKVADRLLQNMIEAENTNSTSRLKK